MTDAAPLRRVESCMGTVFSFDIRSPGVSTEALQKTIDWLHWVDAVFSTYRPDSQINRLDRGELVLAQCDPEVREVLELSAQAKVSTDGYFTVSIDHHLDPSGMVKGWAIERASEMLREAGSSAHAINGAETFSSAERRHPDALGPSVLQIRFVKTPSRPRLRSAIWRWRRRA